MRKFLISSKPVQESSHKILAGILKRYLDNRPAFLSIIRGKEAFLFNSFIPYSRPVLDYGCGDGFFTETSFLKRNQRVDVGLETDVKRAELARNRDFYGKVVVYPGHRVPFPNNSFSTVISNSVLEHVSNIEGSLSEVHRILKKPGRYYVSLTTSQYEKNLFGTLVFGDLYKKWMRKRAYHANMLSDLEIEARFKSVGFSIVKKIGYLNKASTKFLDIMQYISIPSRIPVFSRLYNFLNGLVFMNYILKKVTSETDDGSFCCYFYILSKK